MISLSIRRMRHACERKKEIEEVWGRTRGFGGKVNNQRPDHTAISSYILTRACQRSTPFS